MSNLIDRIFVIDDIISQANQKKIYDTLYHHDFIWHHIFDPTFFVEKSRIKAHPFLLFGIHLILQVDYPILQAALKRFKLSSIGTYKTRSFLHIANPKFVWNRKNHIHVDMDTPHTVVLYYVNDADGTTDLFDEKGRKIKSVKPKMGRCVIFDGSIKHRSSHPKNHNRCIINIDVTKFI